MLFLSDFIQSIILGNICITFPKIQQSKTDFNKNSSSLSIISMKLNAASPWNDTFTKTSKNELADPLLTIDRFLIALIKSEMMGFIWPKNETHTKN